MGKVLAEGWRRQIWGGGRQVVRVEFRRGDARPLLHPSATRGAATVGQRGQPNLGRVVRAGGVHSAVGAERGCQRAPGVGECHRRSACRRGHDLVIEPIAPVPLALRVEDNFGLRGVLPAGQVTDERPRRDRADRPVPRPR